MKDHQNERGPYDQGDRIALREYVEALFDQKDKALDAALATSKEAVVKAETATDRIAARALADQEALRDQMGERLESLRRELQSATSNQKEAVQKAENATERRLEGMNEFRNALSDQGKLMMPRREYEQAHQEIVRQVAQLREDISELRTNVAVGPASLAKLQSFTDTQTGARQGAVDYRTTMLAVLLVLVGIAAFISPHIH